MTNNNQQEGCYCDPYGSTCPPCKQKYHEGRLNPWQPNYVIEPEIALEEAEKRLGVKIIKSNN